MREYLLSIIIPTKNRQFYCKAAIKQILKALSGSVEIVIQDNSDDRSIEDFIGTLDAKNIIYNHHDGVLSFVDNFSEAVSLCHGEYVCMIGDDDGVLPIIEKAAEYCKKNHLDALVPGLNAVYAWPTDTPYLPRAEKGYLYLTPLVNTCRKLDVAGALKQLKHQAFQNYQETWVPRLYHGIVSWEKLEEVKALTGHYFGGLTPDMFMTVALCYVCKNVCATGFPITISGICPSSGSASSATGAHTGELSQAPHFRGHDSYDWKKQVPYVYSVETIWAETGLQAMDEMGSQDDANSVNYTYLMAVMWMLYPQFHPRIKAHMEAYQISFGAMKRTILSIKLGRFTKRAWKAVTGYRLKSKRLYNIPDIEAAEEIINSYMRGIAF
jgi:hypothetical protein